MASFAQREPQRLWALTPISVYCFPLLQRLLDGLDRVDVVVCTIERANGIVNRLIQANDLASLGLVVLDEIHFLADERRGALMESLLIRLSLWLHPATLHHIPAPHKADEAKGDGGAGHGVQAEAAKVKQPNHIQVSSVFKHRRTVTPSPRQADRARLSLYLYAFPHVHGCPDASLAR